MTLEDAVIIGLHTFLAWIFVEIFVNLAHQLSRTSYMIWHYLVIILAFGGVFRFYARWFDSAASPFSVTAVAMGFVLLLEVIVFRYLYSGERWFLNWVDWLFPIFLATTAIYAAMYF